MEKLPVWRIVNDSILFLKDDFAFVIRAAIVPFALLVLSRFILLFWLAGQNYDLQFQGTIIFYVNVIFEQLILIPLWVAIYRRIILGVDAGDFGYLSHLPNKVKYLKYELFFITMMLVPMGIGSYANYHLLEAAQFTENVRLTVSAQYFPYLFVATALYILVLVVSLRFTLVLPAAAIGADAGFEDSWRATKGHVWRLLSYMFFYILVSGLLNYTIRQAIEMPTDSDVSGILSTDMTYSVLLFSMTIPLSVILTAAFAYAFLFLAQQDEQTF